jgi:hypothetical protein
MLNSAAECADRAQIGGKPIYIKKAEVWSFPRPSQFAHRKKMTLPDFYGSGKFGQHVF